MTARPARTLWCAHVLSRVDEEIMRARRDAHLRLVTVAHRDGDAARHAAAALRLGADPTVVADALAAHCGLHPQGGAR